MNVFVHSFVNSNRSPVDGINSLGFVHSLRVGSGYIASVALRKFASSFILGVTLLEGPSYWLYTCSGVGCGEGQSYFT